MHNRKLGYKEVIARINAGRRHRLTLRNGKSEVVTIETVTTHSEGCYSFFGWNYSQHQFDSRGKPYKVGRYYWIGGYKWDGVLDIECLDDKLKS